MGASFVSSRRQPEPEINVTPLVDVVLVLLIIFMVVTPALNEGEHVELPAIMQADPKPKELHPIEVTLAHSGNILVEKQATTADALEATLRDMHQKDPDRLLLLQTDERIPYQKVRKTFALLQDIGFKGVSLKVMEKKPAQGG